MMTDFAEKIAPTSNDPDWAIQDPVMLEKSLLRSIEERQALKAQAEELDARRKELDAIIEGLAGYGTTSVAGRWSVTVCDYDEERFDSTRFKKENPELAAKYLKPAKRHQFKIQELKTTA